MEQSRGARWSTAGHRKKGLGNAIEAVVQFAARVPLPLNEMSQVVFKSRECS